MTDKEKDFALTVTREINELRELIWGLDIPSPTVPEYVEFHESIQKILNKIDSMEVFK